MNTEYKWRDYLAYTILYGDTRPSRFWLGVVNIFFAMYMFKSWDNDPNFTMQLASFSYHAVVSAHIWEILFLIHAGFLFAGLSGRYSVFTLFFEGLLGWTIWTWTALMHWMMQGVPGPTAACCLIMTWILIRYPTHWTKWGARDD